MKSRAFNTLYKQLNKEQKKAVDAIEGPVMVIAGPGTGKTQILTLRIANILKKTDTSPDSILALTFTESGAFSMRKRLVEIIGSEGYRVNIHTFHGFCNEIIKRFPDSFARIIGATNINDLDKVSLLKEIILSSEFLYLKPFGNNFYYIHPLRNKISELKRENITPKYLKKIIKKQKDDYKKIDDLYYTDGIYKGKIRGKYKNLEKRIVKNEELLFVYEKYEKLLEDRHLYDYEDMIIETIRALKSNEDLLLTLQEEYQYILADEHQDVNNAQNKLLELLTNFHENPNIFIVGDEKQAIFRFQGASLDNFLYFKELHKEALSITLKDNYRSTQSILDSSHSLIQKNPVLDEKLRIKLISRTETKNTPIEISEFSKPEFELLFIAKDIEEKISHGIEPQEIAVLYRNNKDADALVHILEKTEISFRVESDQNIMNDPDISKFISLLRVIEYYGDDAQLLQLLHANFLNIDNLDIYKIITFGQKNKLSLFDILKSKKYLKNAHVEDAETLHKLYTNLSLWKKTATNKGILDTIQLLAYESGFIDHLLSGEDVIEKLEKLSGLFNEITKLIENHKEYEFSDLIKYFDDLQEHNIIVRKDSKNISTGSVRLMTAHKSKGLEFDYVYIIGVYNGHWGNRRILNHFSISINSRENELFDENDDERRLFYVALTRAKVGVSISYSKEGNSGKMQLPSQFIEEIDKLLIHKKNTEKFEKNIDTSLLLMPGRHIATPPIKDKKFLNSLFIEQGLSVTALNNYLECPWNYFYSNLLRIPKVLAKHLLFGTSVHNTLKELFDRGKNGEKISKKKLIEIFINNIKKQPFTESELKEAMKKGKKAFSGYFDRYSKTWIKNVLNEYSVISLLNVNQKGLENIKLRGILDKIEILVNSQNVNVVDYKTGKPRTRNYIEGKTKTSNGNYKRQLIFYKLLLDLQEKQKFTMLSGEIDFVEPDDKNKYHKENFVIEEGEVEGLKELIKKVTKDIMTLKFWDSVCDRKDCEYCLMRSNMKV